MVGLEERIERIWDMVGTGEGSLKSKDRVVKLDVCDTVMMGSHDEIMQPSSLRRRNFEKRLWVRNSETSTGAGEFPLPPSTIDRMPLGRISSRFGVNEEMMEPRSSESL